MADGKTPEVNSETIEQERLFKLTNKKKVEGEKKKETETEKKETKEIKAWVLRPGHSFSFEMPISGERKGRREFFSIPDYISEVCVRLEHYQNRRKEWKSRHVIEDIIYKDDPDNKTINFGDSFISRGERVEFNKDQVNKEGEIVEPKTIEVFQTKAS